MSSLRNQRGCAQAALLLRLLVGKIQVDEHEHPRLGIHTEQGDKANPIPRRSCCSPGSDQIGQTAEKDAADRTMRILLATGCR